MKTKATQLLVCAVLSFVAGGTATYAVISPASGAPVGSPIAAAAPLDAAQANAIAPAAGGAARPNDTTPSHDECLRITKLCSDEATRKFFEGEPLPMTGGKRY